MSNYPALKSRVLATDLDNTIVSKEVSHTILWDTLSLPHTSLIYITGRYKQSALQLIEEEQLPIPDILICDVGASIYIGPNFELVEEWAEQIKHIDFERVKTIASSINIKQQPIDTPWRLAFFANPHQMQAFKNKISEENLAVDVIYSSGQDMDVLPKNINKGTALTFVLEKTQYEGEVVVAGDSENDLSLFQLGLPSIAVGNACDAIINLQNAEHIHFAKEHAAAGVKEIWTKLYELESEKRT